MNLIRLLRPTAALLLALGLAAVATAAEPPSAPAAESEIERARAELRRAQDELSRAAKALARATHEARLDSPRALAYAFVTDPDRAVLGITIADGPERKAKLHGVLVTGVTPGGGADKAGLKSGDLLLSANGSSLVSATDDARSPAQRLRDIMSALKPGDTVKLDYERAGRSASATVTASRPQHPMAPLPMFGWDDDEDSDVLIPPIPPFAVRVERGDGGMQLARLDDDLAAYFKTRDGVLVVRAPEGGTLGLKSGDVIRRINGRSVASPVAAWEELGQAGDSMRMEVVRHGKEVTLEGTLPDLRGRGDRQRIVIERKDR